MTICNKNPTKNLRREDEQPPGEMDFEDRDQTDILLDEFDRVFASSFTLHDLVLEVTSNLIRFFFTNKINYLISCEHYQKH